MDRRLLILTEGFSDPLSAKTAVSVVRYRAEQVVAILDSTCRGKTSQQVLGVGGDIPVVGSVAEAPAANTLLIGIAPPGGRLPADMRRAVLEAIERGMTIESGLHEFLSEDLQFAAAAKRAGAVIRDIRKNDERDVAERQGIDERCLRIHTVGNDCCVGKMVAAIEIARGLARSGCDAKFVATGQTGIMIEGDGCPIDRVISDFVNGAAEKLVLQNQHHQVIVIEGQGSIVHPRYSAVALGILHGCIPDGLVLCYEAGRTHVNGMEWIALPSIPEMIRLNEAMASAMHPCRVLGIAMNGRCLSANAAEQERRRVEGETGLAVCDVLRDGPEALCQAILQYKQHIGK